MKRPHAEARRWLGQARSDLGYAEPGVREGYYAQACFMSQQAAEEALQAVHYLDGARFVFGHSLVELLEAPVDRHAALATLRDAARQLDQYDISTRYPNGLPGGVPADVFSKGQAEQAVTYARRFLDEAQRLLGEG